MLSKACHWYLLRKSKKITLEGIGGIYGRKHPTVLTGIRKIENFLELHDKKTEELIELLSLGVNKKLTTNIFFAHMGKVNIELNGITSTSTYPDGEMISLVNLRKKGGALEPVPPRKITKTLSDTYDFVFVHQLPSTGENWIGVKGNTVYLDTGITKTSLCSVSS